jgi:hypothetical protein
VNDVAIMSDCAMKKLAACRRDNVEAAAFDWHDGMVAPDRIA